MRVLLAVHITCNAEVLEQRKQVRISVGNVMIVGRIAEVGWLKKQRNPL